MNTRNRLAVVALALITLGLASFIIAITWGADTQAIDRLADFVSYLDEHTDNQSKVILTLAALAPILVALMVITLEVLPERPADIRLMQAGGVTAVLTADSVGELLAQDLRSMPEVLDAAVKVYGRSNGMAATVELTLDAGVNIASASEAARRVVQEAAERRVGVPLVAPPTIRVRLTSGPAAPTSPEETTSSEG